MSVIFTHLSDFFLDVARGVVTINFASCAKEEVALHRSEESSCRAIVSCGFAIASVRYAQWRHGGGKIQIISNSASLFSTMEPMGM